MSIFYMPRAQAFDTSGLLISGAKLNFYEAGTSTRKNTYSDALLTTANANPVVANSVGLFGPIFMGTGEYKVVFTDASDTELWSVDELTFGGETQFVDLQREYGATGDGVTDDTVAIEAALSDMLSTGRRGILYARPGTYITSNAIVVSGLSIGIAGEAGETATIFKGTHTDGPVFQMKNRRQFLRDIEIASDATRTAAAAGTNFGVQIEGDDTASGKADFGEYENVYVRDQPNSGIIVVGSSHHCNFRKCSIRDSQNGHGIQFDDGTATSRTNKAIPGLSKVKDCQIFDNDGHGMLIGNDDNGTSNRAIRVMVDNTDIFRNAEAAGSRKSAFQVWGFGDNLRFEECGIDGSNQAEDTATTGGLELHGRSNKAIQNRYLNLGGAAVRFDVVSTYPTNGEVDEMHVVQDLGSDLDPAVAVHADVDYVSVKSKSSLGIDRLVTDGAAGLEKHSEIAVKTSAEAVTASTTLQDDDDLKATLLTYERVQFKAHLWVDGPAAGNIKLGFTVPASAVLVWGPVNNMKVDTSLALAVQNPVTSGSIDFGTAGAGTTTLIELVGEVRTNGTAGDLQLQFAQVTSDAGNTRILAQSWLEVLR